VFLQPISTTMGCVAHGVSAPATIDSSAWDLRLLLGRAVRPVGTRIVVLAGSVLLAPA